MRSGNGNGMADNRYPEGSVSYLGLEYRLMLVGQILQPSPSMHVVREGAMRLSPIAGFGISTFARTSCGRDLESGA